MADNQTGAGICLAGRPLMHNLHPRSLHVQAGITASTKLARNRGEKRGSLTTLSSPPPPFHIILNLLCLPSWAQFLCSALRLPTAAKMSYSGLSMAAFVGIATLIVYLVIDRVRGHSRLKHIPGPFGTGWTDLWMLRAQLSGRMCFLLAEANEKYGKVSRSHKSAFALTDWCYSQAPLLKSRRDGWSAGTARNSDASGESARAGSGHIGIAGCDLILTRTMHFRPSTTRSTRGCGAS